MYRFESKNMDAVTTPRRIVRSSVASKSDTAIVLAPSSHKKKERMFGGPIGSTQLYICDPLGGKM